MASSFFTWLFGSRPKIGILLSLIATIAFGVGFTLLSSKMIYDFVYGQTIDVYAMHLQEHASEQLIPGDWIAKWKDPGSADVFLNYQQLVRDTGNVVRFNLYTTDAIVVWSSSSEDIGKVEEAENIAKTIGGQVFIEHAESTNDTVIRSGIRDLIEIYIPLKRPNGTVVGIAEVYVDATNDAALILRTQITFGLSALTALVGIFLLLRSAFVRQNREMARLVKERTGALMSLQDQYHGAVEGSLVGIYILQDGVFRFVNTKFFRIFGYERTEEVIGRSFNEVITGEGAQDVVTRRRRYQTKKKDGTPIIVEVLSNLSSFEGRPADIGSLQDVTDLIHAEGNLRQARDTSQQYLDIADVLLVATDMDMKVTMMNRKGGQILGVAPTDAIGQDFVTEYYPARNQEKVLEHFHRFMAGDLKEGEYHEAPQVSKNGVERMLGWHHSLVHDAGGKVVGVLSSGEDITEKRRAQLDDQLHLKITALLLSNMGIEETVQKMSQYMCEAFDWIYAEDWTVNASGRSLVRRASWLAPGRSMTGLTNGKKKIGFPFEGGVTSAAFLGDEPMWVRSLSASPDFLRKKEAAEDGVVSALVFPYRLDTRTASVSLFYSASSDLPGADVFTMLRSVRGQLISFLEQKKAAQRIKELNDLRNTFIQIVSHQLRTPLNAIRWNLEALLTDELGELKKEQKEFIRLTYRADVEVISRIHDLLTAMDIEEGRVTLARSEGSIESLWDSILFEWKKKCEAKDVHVEYVPPSAPLTSISFDAERMREVFEKVASNACDYTPAGGTVTARLLAEDGKARFEIADTGIGIPAAEQSRIFTRFFRASNASMMKPDASGLGLAIAKYYVEQHEGSIGFTSEEGKGSTFWFEIPTGSHG